MLLVGTFLFLINILLYSFVSSNEHVEVTVNIIAELKSGLELLPEKHLTLTWVQNSGKIMSAFGILVNFASIADSFADTSVSLSNVYQI